MERRDARWREAAEAQGKGGTQGQRSGVRNVDQGRGRWRGPGSDGICCGVDGGGGKVRVRGGVTAAAAKPEPSPRLVRDGVAQHGGVLRYVCGAVGEGCERVQVDMYVLTPATGQAEFA